MKQCSLAYVHNVLVHACTVYALLYKQNLMDVCLFNVNFYRDKHIAWTNGIGQHF